MTRYRAVIRRKGTERTTMSPLMVNQQLAWSFALGWAQGWGEDFHVMRELDGYIDEPRLATFEGSRATYSVEEVT